MQDVDRRQQILEGALKVFSTEGFHKASIKKIARAAEIKSSALIYHYFEDKKALLRAVVKEVSPLRDVPMLKSVSTEELLDIPPEIFLGQLAGQVFRFLDDDTMRNLIRLFLSESVRMPEVAGLLADTQQTLLDFLIRYFDHQQEKGIFRVYDSRVSARAFMGMMIIKIMTELVFVHLNGDTPDTETYAKETVRIFLDGMRSDS